MLICINSTTLSYEYHLCIKWPKNQHFKLFSFVHSFIVFLQMLTNCIKFCVHLILRSLTLVWQYNVYSMYYWNVHYLYPIATSKLKSGQLLLMLLSFSILCCLNLSDNKILIHNCLFTTRLLLHIYRKSIFSHNQSEICFVLQRTQCSLHVPFVYSCTRVHY